MPWPITVVLLHEKLGQGTGRNRKLLQPCLPFRRRKHSLALPDGNDGVREVLLSGSLALVAARGSGLLIYDVSRPQKPGLAGRFRPAGMFRSGRWNAFAVSVSNGTVALKAGPFAFILEDER